MNTIPLLNSLAIREPAFSPTVLTVSFVPHKVIAAHFAAAHLDSHGVPVPATGATMARIDAEWQRVRRCAGLLAHPPN